MLSLQPSWWRKICIFWLIIVTPASKKKKTIVTPFSSFSSDPEYIEIDYSFSDSGDSVFPGSHDISFDLDKGDSFIWEPRICRYISKKSGVLVRWCF